MVLLLASFLLCIIATDHVDSVKYIMPKVYHLLFADDTLIFCKDSRLECEKLKTILGLYKVVSSQKVILTTKKKSKSE